MHNSFLFCGNCRAKCSKSRLPESEAEWTANLLWRQHSNQNRIPIYLSTDYCTLLCNRFNLKIGLPLPKDVPRFQHCKPCFYNYCIEFSKYQVPTQFNKQSKTMLIQYTTYYVTCRFLCFFAPYNEDSVLRFSKERVDLVKEKIFCSYVCRLSTAKLIYAMLRYLTHYHTFLLEIPRNQAT